MKQEEEERVQREAMARVKREEIERQLDNDSKMLDNDIEGMLGYESLEDKKERMIEEGRMKAEVKKEVKEYEEKLMGNSRLLQDPSGKLPKKS